MANEFKVRKSLVVNGSGSVLLDVQGSQGQLFSITDSLSGSLFAVKDISGMPVMEAFSDNTVRLGQFGSKALFVSQSRVGIGKETPLNAILDISGSATVTGSLNVTGSILQNGGALAVQDGTILYSPTRAFTPTGSISTSGTTVTVVGNHFTSAVVGMKLTISGESRIIATYTSATQVSVNLAYSQDYSGVASGSWGVYYKTFEVKTDGYPYFYLGNQSGGAPPGTVFLSNNGGSVNTQYAFTQGNNVYYGQDIDSFNSFKIRWSNSSTYDAFSNTTNDLGLRRNSAGILEVYNGTTADGTLANRADLLVRNITGSNAVFSGSVNVSGSLTTTGTITAQTLLVQTISSSVEYSSGSNVFGSLLSNTHQFTGSVGMTGSLSVIGASAFSGSVNIVSGSLTVASASLSVSGSLSINGINITATGGFQQTFTAATTWTATHNLNTLYPVITVYNNSGQVIIPTSITSTDANTTTVTFNTAVAGTINILSGQLQQNVPVQNPTAVALSTVLGG